MGNEFGNIKYVGDAAGRSLNFFDRRFFFSESKKTSCVFHMNTVNKSVRWICSAALLTDGCIGMRSVCATDTRKKKKQMSDRVLNLSINMLKSI